MTANLLLTLQAAHADAPDRPFLRVPDRGTLSYGDVDARSAQLAGALRAAGVDVGDRVVVQVDKSTDAVALYLACLCVGAVLLPLNTAYTEAEVGFFVDDATPAFVVARPGTLEGIAARSGVRRETLGTEGDGSFAELARNSTPVDEVVERGAGDLAAMLYTSGVGVTFRNRIERSSSPCDQVHERTPTD